jgi:hypothetical protein
LFRIWEQLRKWITGIKHDALPWLNMWLIYEAEAPYGVEAQQTSHQHAALAAHAASEKPPTRKSSRTLR